MEDRKIGTVKAEVSNTKRARKQGLAPEAHIHWLWAPNILAMSCYSSASMPNYSKLHDLVSHRVTIEYDTGARITGYLASCQPASGPVEFVVLSDAKLVDSRGNLQRETAELVMCPNALTSIAVAEGPRGRDVAKT